MVCFFSMIYLFKCILICLVPQKSVYWNETIARVKALEILGPAVHKLIAYIFHAGDDDSNTILESLLSYSVSVLPIFLSSWCSCHWSVSNITLKLINLVSCKCFPYIMHLIIFCRPLLYPVLLIPSLILFYCPLWSS